MFEACSDVCDGLHTHSAGSVLSCVSILLCVLVADVEGSSCSECSMRQCDTVCL